MVDNQGTIRDGTSLALDSQDKAHISYSDPTNDDLKYITNTSGLWVTETVDNEDGCGYSSSLAIASHAHSLTSGTLKVRAKCKVPSL